MHKNALIWSKEVIIYTTRCNKMHLPETFRPLSYKTSQKATFTLYHELLKCIEEVRMNKDKGTDFNKAKISAK